jgi:outer membrane protein OmpA-like peptidoglycan-associated protein
MNNCRVSNRLFALNYGLMVEYRIADRLHVSLEAANTTTWSNWDRNGESYRLGDHMLQLSAGLTYTIGKNGWKKVVDPAPYIHQNDLLMEKLGKMQNENNKLNRLHKTDAMALEEMRKILEIEGLLDKYELIETDTTSGSRIKPKNSYSGLNSLRSRLRNKNWNGEEPKVATNEKTDSNSGDPNNYFHLMKDGKVYVGAPIFIFFKLGTDELTEKAQIINIKEIASTINKYGMYARVVGAADSQTGAAYTNEKLSEKRADYVAKLLVKHGVAKEKITQQHRGGISSYEPMSGNRNTCVMLYYTEKQGN